MLAQCARLGRAMFSNKNLLWFQSCFKAVSEPFAPVSVLGGAWSQSGCVCEAFVGSSSLCQDVRKGRALSSRCYIHHQANRARGVQGAGFTSRSLLSKSCERGPEVSSCRCRFCAQNIVRFGNSVCQRHFKLGSHPVSDCVSLQWFHTVQSPVSTP